MKTQGFNEDLTHLLAHKLTFTWVIIFCGLCWSSPAQEKPVRDLIENLRNGTLYVVMPTHQKKVTALRAQLTKDLSKGETARTTKLLRDTEKERDLFIEGLQTAFDKAYRFSDHIFIPDQDLAKFLKEMDADQETYTFFLDYGLTENGAGALIISDYRRQPLKRPFPYFARTGRTSAIFDAFFGTNDPPWRDLTKVTMKLDQRLTKFYQKHF